MPSLHIQPFLGMIPKRSANILPDGASQVASNVKLYSGELRSWNKPLLVSGAKIVAGAKTLYQLYGTGGVSKFLSWAGDVDVVNGPLSDSTDFRIYYTGDSTPRKTNWALAIQGSGTYPYDYLEMGVPAPTTAPTLTVTNGTGTAESRVYLVTFVSTFGSLTEESAPSPVAACTINPTGGSVLLNAFPAPPAGKYNITNMRIYRTLSGTSSYGLVAQIPISQTSYTDTTVTGSYTTFLASTYYTPPPSYLQGIVSMPNGMLAGFGNNEVWFSEPYKPHAWPVSYMLTVDAPVVGLGVFGNALVVMTQKSPYIFYGSSPSAMTQEMLPLMEPCVSKRSIANDEMGVLYVSPNGVVGIGANQRGLITSDQYTRIEWQLQNPAFRFGKLYGRQYIIFDSSQSSSSRSAIVIQRDASADVTTLYEPATAFYIDRVTGNAYMASDVDGNLYQIDADAINFQPYEWKSKRYTVPQPVNFSVYQVDADYSYMSDAAGLQATYNYLLQQNVTMYLTGTVSGAFNKGQINTYQFNGSQLKTLPNITDTRSITAFIFADGNLVASSPVTSLNPLRIGAGYKAYNWEIKLSGNVPIRSFAIATSVGELKQV